MHFCVLTLHLYLQVLRFSRLFKPAHSPHIWRKKRKKKEEEDKKDGKDDDKQKKDSKKKDSKDTKGGIDKEVGDVAATVKDGVDSGSRDESGAETAKNVKAEEGMEEEKEESEEEVDLKINFGRPPKKEEIMEDDEVRD